MDDDLQYENDHAVLRINQVHANTSYADDYIQENISSEGKMNICFEYLYRDAGNNKIWGEVVLANEHHLNVSDVTAQILPLLIDGHFFEAEEIQIPLLQFDTGDSDIDHGWHEFSTLSETEEPVTDAHKRDIAELLRMFETAAQIWKQYT